MQTDKAAYHWLVEQSRGQRGYIVLLSLLRTTQAAVLVGFALACRGIIDAAVAGSQHDLVMSSVALGVLILMMLGMRIASSAMSERIKARTSMQLRQTMLSHLLTCRYGSVLQYHSGELSNRMFSDVQVVSNGVATMVPSLVSMVAQLVLVMATLAWISPQLVALFIGAALVALVLARVMRGRLKRLHTDVQEKEGAVRVIMQEALEHQLVIRSFGAAGLLTGRAQGLQQDHFAAQMRRRDISTAANATFGFFFNALYLLSLVWCAFSLLEGTMSYGTLMAVVQLTGRIQTPVTNLSGLLPQLYQTTASAERLMEVVDFEIAGQQVCGSVAEFYERLRGIRAQDVIFVYQDASEDEEHLRCASAYITKGSLVAVMGPSGSGKSTLFKLLLGAYDAEGLCFELTDGVACAGSAVPRGAFAYVPQDNFMFSGSIRDNVIFAADADEATVQHACQLACAWDFIQELPDGLDTVLGEHGQGLSQGQLQRLAIARAICSGAPIMVLDEVTSALDEATEAQVLSNVAGLEGVTVFVAAHRPRVLDFCTTRLNVCDGNVTQEG